MSDAEDLERRLEAGETVSVHEVNAMLVKNGMGPIDFSKSREELILDLIALTGLSVEELQAITGRKLAP